MMNRVLPRPDAAPRHGVDPVDILLPRLRDPRDELPVLVLETLLDDLARNLAQAAIEPEVAGQHRRADAVHVHAQLFERALEGGEDREDADRAGEGRGARDDAVGVHRDVIAARGCEAAHRCHDGRARLAQSGDLATYDLARKDAAAGAVDPQDHSSYVLVVARIAELAGEAVAADHAGRLLAGNDFTRSDDHADLVGGRDRKRSLRAQVREIRPVIDADVGLVVAVRAGDLHQPLLDVGATL